MNVYVYSPPAVKDTPFQIALRRNSISKNAARHFVESMCFKDRQPKALGWLPPPMMLRWDSYASGGVAQACDFPVPDDSGSLVMSEHAMRELASELEPYGEFLPLDCNEGSFWIFNVTFLVDALDVESSEWLPVPGEPSLLWREAFLPERIKDQIIFRLPIQYKKSQTYFTNRFLKIIQEKGLTGFDARLVWADTSVAAEAEAHSAIEAARNATRDQRS